MAKRKHSSSKEEQLYKLDVFVDQLNLHPGNILNETIGSLTVRVKFPDLTAYELNPVKTANRNEGQGSSELNQGVVTSGTAKSCLFARTPDNFIKAMRNTPLRIEVYTEKPRNTEKKGIPVCVSYAPVPACFRDQITAARNKTVGLSTPCVSTGTYTLTDSHGAELGTVSLSLRLCCLGSSVVKHFSLQEKSFEIHNISLHEDGVCPNSDGKNKENGNGSDSPWKFLLRSPESPPRISMDDPGFEKLTTAEKLNDPMYRNLVYKTYPDEPTCSCVPSNRSRHPLECRSGCKRPCCMRLREPSMLLKKRRKKKDVKDAPSTSNYCVSGPAYKLSMIDRDAGRCDRTRLRGGGDVEQIYVGPARYTWTDYDTDCGWYDDGIHAESRLEGGGGREYGRSGCSCSGATAEVSLEGLSKEPNAAMSVEDSCKPRARTAGGPTADCLCPGKEEGAKHRGNVKCTKTPCLGVDCLIRAFREAQDFVDSLGKVPGLAGLGLMDPSESPYFGRDIDKEYTSQDSEAERRRVPGAQSVQNPYCRAPCGTQISKPGLDSGSVPYTLPAPLTITVPGRTGVVREAVPTLPDTSSVIASTRHRKKEERKEEKIEKQKELDAASAVPLDVDGGPCGEPKCKSRPRKKPVDIAPAVQETAEPPQKKSGVHVKPSSTASPKSGSRTSERGRHPKGKSSVSVGGGDRAAPGRPPIKVSRRIMRYVYTIGDAYPGINYGHKNCIDPRLRVPANMGWLWNTRATADNLKPRLGWKPGAIGRYLNEMLKEAKAGSQREATRPRSVPSRTRRPKAYRSMSFTSVKKMQAKKEGEDEVEAPPTLHVHRKDGTYYVTMYPVKQETGDASQLQEPMKPLQFKIVKNKDDASLASSSTASDMEIEFSPPAAINKYRKKPDVVHVHTQVRQQEILDALKPADATVKKERKVKKEKKGKK